MSVKRITRLSEPTISTIRGERIMLASDLAQARSCAA